MKPKTRSWIHGLFAIFISSGAAAISGYTADNIVSVEMRKVYATAGSAELFRILASRAIAGGLIGIVAYLKQSPLPPINGRLDEIRKDVIRNLPKPRVLLVDDDDALRDVIINVIPEARWIDVGSCADAKRMITAFEYDVIVMDVILGDCDGRDLLAELRPYSKARAIFITGSPDMTSMLESRAMTFLQKGGNDFIDELRKFILAGRPRIVGTSQSADGIEI